MEAYAADKAKVFAHQVAGDVAVIDIDDPGSAPYAESAGEQGATVCRVSRLTMPACGRVPARRHARPGGARRGASARLRRRPRHQGRPQREQRAGCCRVCPRCRGRSGVDPSRSASLPADRASPGACRASSVAPSTSTTPRRPIPDAVMKALTAFGERPLVLLLGGRNKGIDLRARWPSGSRRGARGVVLFGEAREPSSSGRSRVSTVEQRRGRRAWPRRSKRPARWLRPARSSLLSPGCTSFDEFAGYEERGLTLQGACRCSRGR